jgi:hypothetical protein
MINPYFSLDFEAIHESARKPNVMAFLRLYRNRGIAELLKYNSHSTGWYNEEQWKNKQFFPPLKAPMVSAGA